MAEEIEELNEREITCPYCHCVHDDPSYTMTPMVQPAKAARSAKRGEG